MSPKATLEHLKKNATARTQRTLDAIFLVCQEHADSGSLDFAFSTVARLGENRGVPKAESIRSTKAAHYRTLIKAFAAACPRRKFSPRKNWVGRVNR
ncbi:gamma-mobile-trio protein GmtX [Pseudomonas sp. NPDC086278]|uniref:gamma-mobile-trio protein GmtX n=1 Tax=Pseudomonas sp. NPDC086278 TaxID=3390646 RepID=UPI003D062BD5